MANTKKKAPVNPTVSKAPAVGIGKPATKTEHERTAHAHTTHSNKPSKEGSTKVVVHYDCGYPNTLFIRGEGVSTLSWDKGLPLKNMGSNEWVWETDRPFSIMQFKILINDGSFEQGNNHSLAYGQKLDFSPKF